MHMKQIIKNIPVIGPVGRRVYRTWINPPRPFQGSESYWKHRYEAGGNSGDGSYNQLAEFKAEILNPFGSDNSLRTPSMWCSTTSIRRSSSGSASCVKQTIGYNDPCNVTF
jgi:hypothetical protein